MTGPPVVEQVNLQDRRHRMLSPFLAERIRDYAAAKQPELTDPATFAGLVMSRLWTGHPGTACWVIVDPTTGALIGHALAGLEQLGSSLWAGVVQPPEKSLGPARFAALDAVMAWAVGHGVPRVIVSTDTRDKALQERYHARLYRHLMEIPCAPTAPAPEPVAVA